MLAEYKKLRVILSKLCSCRNYSNPRCNAEAPSTTISIGPINYSDARSFAVHRLSFRPQRLRATFFSATVWALDVNNGKTIRGFESLIIPLNAFILKNAFIIVPEFISGDSSLGYQNNV